MQVDGLQEAFSRRMHARSAERETSIAGGCAGTLFRAGQGGCHIRK